MQLSSWKKRALAIAGCAAVLISVTALTPARATNFTRGDTNADGRFDLSDGVNILLFLFGGDGVFLPCQDAADGNDSGLVDLSDGVFLFTHLFLGGPPPAHPAFPTCGVDPTDDDGLGCADYPTCDQDVDPPVIGNLTLVAVTDSTATIYFETDEPATATFDYGLDDSYGEQQEQLSLQTAHQFDLTGLNDGTEYHYQITVTDESGNSFSSSDQAFNTVPARSELGDIGHVLNRLTYGPTADLIDHVREIGVAAYIEEQIGSDANLDDGNEALTSRMADLFSEERFHDIEPIVPIASMWRYLKGIAEPPADWTAPGFDDSAWAEGVAGFGYGDRDDNTVLEDMPARADNPETVDVDESQR